MRPATSPHVTLSVAAIPSFLIYYDYDTMFPLTFTFSIICSASSDLEKLSSLGHFLKGSSATLGLVKVREGCEKIQRYGKKENVDGSPEPNESLCLNRIKDEIKTVKEDIAEAHRAFNAYYDKEQPTDA